MSTLNRDEGIGTEVLAGSLILFVVLAITAATGTIDDLIVWMLGDELINAMLSTLTIAVFLTGGFVAFRVAPRRQPRRGHALRHAHAGSDARQVRGPVSGGDGSHFSPSVRAGIERHERRHQRVADALGVGGNWWLHDHGGSFQRNNDSHLSGVQRAAISYAGNRGNWWAGAPCDGRDEANAAHYIESAYPRSEWYDRHREARALARRLS